MKHMSLNGLRPHHEYLEILQGFYPNVPFEKIKELEKKIFNETELKLKLQELNNKR